MDKKREGDEDDAPAIDPNDGGSMRGEKMVSSRVDDTSEHKHHTLCNAGASDEAEEARLGRSGTAPAGRINRRTSDPYSRR